MHCEQMMMLVYNGIRVNDAKWQDRKIMHLHMVVLTQNH